MPRGPLLVVVAGLALHTTSGSAQTCASDCLMAGPYTSLALENQLIGADYLRRDLIVSWGRAVAYGERGDWTGLVEARGGFVASQKFADGLVAGPRVTLNRTLAGRFFLEVEPGARTELYLGVSAGAVATWVFQGPGQGARLVPSVGLGLGFRLPGPDREGNGLRRNSFTAELFWEGRWPRDFERVYLRFAMFRPRSRDVGAGAAALRAP